jgi:hypothetical protein
MISGSDSAMSPGLVVEEGREEVSSLGAVGIQPLTGLARIISDVMISARYHLSRFMFASVACSVDWQKSFVKLR